MNLCAKIFLYAFFIAFSSFLTACKNEADDDQIQAKVERTLKVNRNDLNSLKKTNFSELVESTKLVKLATNKNCLIGAVNKIYVQGDRIYILDNQITSSIFVFNLNGDFLYKINNKGRGPFEYLEIDDFALDQTTGQLIVLDGQKKRLFYYNDLGKPVRESKLPFYADNFDILASDKFAFLGSATENRIIIWNSEKEKIIRSAYKYDEKQTVKVIKPLSRYKQELYYTQTLNDTIIKINDKSISKNTVIDFGQYKVKDSDLQRGFLGTLSATGDIMTNVHLFNESDKFIYFVFDYASLSKTGPFYTLFSKRSKKPIFFTNETMLDDVTFYPYAPQIKTVTADDQFIFPIPAVEIVKSIQRVKKNGAQGTKNFATFFKVTGNVKETDNPVIAFYQFKPTL